MSFGLAEISVTNFRSARNIEFRPGPVCAFIGESGAGKSNVLESVRVLLDPAAPPLLPDDVTRGERTSVIEGRLHDGTTVTLDDRWSAPPVLFFPARARAEALLAPTARRGPIGERAVELIEDALEASPAPRVALIWGLEACAAELSGLIVLIEEPELFLAPPGQRYLYRLLERLAAQGNQVFYTTHSAAFLNIVRLEEIAVVTYEGDEGSTVRQLEPIDADDEFRAACEFDAERSELFLSRATILVEGLTEKVGLPYVFAALGHDADREAISVVECGGKANIPLFVEICKRVGVPYVVVHDSDAKADGKPPPGEAHLNTLIAEAAGADRTVVLDPDFEGALGLHRKSRKPAQAWHYLSKIEAPDLPEPIRRAVELSLEIARPGPPTYS